MVSAQAMTTTIVHQLPGRVRVCINGLPIDAEFIERLVEGINNIYGVIKATLNVSSGRTLILYDWKVIDADGLIVQLKSILEETIESKECLPEKLAPEPEEHDQVAEGENARQYRSKFLFFAGAAGVLGIKKLIWGPSALSLSPFLIQAAAITSVISGYPIIRRKISEILSKGPVNGDKVIENTKTALTICRESVPGLTASALGKSISLEYARARAQTGVHMGEKPPGASGGKNSSDLPPEPGNYTRHSERFSLGIAAATGLVTRSWNRGLAVALAGSPSPAEMVGPAVGAGILKQALVKGLSIKNYRAFTDLADSTMVLFSSGDILGASVAPGQVYTAPGFRRKEVLSLAASICSSARHGLAGPLSFAALSAGGTQLHCMLTGSGGNGMTGTVDGVDVIFGCARYVGLAAETPWTLSKVMKLNHLGQNPLFVVKQGKLCGMVGVKYRPREDVAQVLNSLRAQGLQPALVDTDDMDCRFLAEAYAIESVFMASSPQEKLELIDRLKEETKPVLVTWDGKDGVLQGKLPVIALDTGVSGADVYVVSEGMGCLPEAFRLAHAHRTKMQQSISLMRILNAVGLALTASGRLPFMKAALYANISKIVVGLLSRRHKVPVKNAGSSGDPGKPTGKVRQYAGENSRSNLSLVSNSASGVHGEWPGMATKSVLQLLNTSISGGLSSDHVQRLLERYGSNSLIETRPPTLLQRFAGQLNNLLVKTLMGSTIMCVFLGEIGDAVAILAIVFLNAIFGMFQEKKADQSLAALKKMSAPTAKVVREGRQQTVVTGELVPGDIVVLEQGDTVPADLRLLEAARLEINEASLTGESYPVLKHSQPEPDCLLLQDCHNMAFSGTTVTRGRGVGVVVATGMNTEIGKIAGYLQESDNEETPLQRRMEHISKAVLKGCFLVAGMVVAVGVARGHGFLGMFMTGVSLAVAAIPEGLPATVTMALAAGVRRMARKNAVVRRLPGIETLGNTTVICSDKTGTLTKNELTVRAVYCPGQIWQVSGTGYEPSDGCFIRNNLRINHPDDPDLKELLTAGVLCNDASIGTEPAARGRRSCWTVSGDPMEGSILVAAKKANIDFALMRKKLRRIAEIPFDSDRSCMTTVNAGEEDDAMSVYTKGALEKVLECCFAVQAGGVTEPLNDQWLKEIMKCNDLLTRRSMRVLAVAKRIMPRNESPAVEELEQDMVFLGLIGMVDPLRPEVRGAVDRCRRAGIRVCMITGDHGNTARAIAEQLELENHHLVVTGRELDHMTDEELKDIVQSTSVFARVMPRHKLRLVKVLRALGEVVAMIGDGVNDAPAVKEADIGVAMGSTGTDVTKQSSVMVITDDNFATLVGAIEQGRGIFENIKRSVGYQLATNAGEVIMMMLSVVLGMPLPLLPIQLLWLNLLGDGLPALALGIDKPSSGLMDQAPRPRDSSIFDEGLRQRIVSRGVAIGITATAAYAAALKMPGGLGAARTVALATLTLSQFLYAITCRRENMRQGVGKVPANPYLTGSLAISTALLGAAVYLPAARAVFKTVPLNPMHWAVVAGGTIISAGLDKAIRKLFGSWDPVSLFAGRNGLSDVGNCDEQQVIDECEQKSFREIKRPGLTTVISPA